MSSSHMFESVLDDFPELGDAEPLVGKHERSRAQSLDLPETRWCFYGSSVSMNVGIFNFR